MFIKVGQEKISLPEELTHSAQIISPQESTLKSLPLDTGGLLAEAFTQPINSPPFNWAIKGGKRVALLLPDITRPFPATQILPLIINELNSLGYNDEQITIFFALGIHRPHTPAEHRKILGEEIFKRIKHCDHNAFADDSSFLFLGSTKAGTPIIVNRHLLEHDRIILLGSITYHYFAGFGGGRKLLIPGMSSFGTCRANHLLLLDKHGRRRQGVAPASLTNNPVHIDMIEGSLLIPTHFCFNIILNSEGAVENIIAGNLIDSHLTACRLFLETYSVGVDSLFDVVVVSAGGFPKDINFIQAHKSLEMAFLITRPRGTILLLAECPEGVGHPDFLNWFDYENLNSLAIELTKNYQIYGQTAYATLWKTSRVDVLLFSRLEKSIAQRMRMIPVESMEEAVAYIQQKHFHTPRIAIMPHGAHILPRLPA